MKKLTLSLCAVLALASAAFAGTETYSSKNVKQVAPAPCPTWYADNEWNIGVWGTYAPTVNGWREDTYLGVDHAWGGGIDASYFFRRYFGIGISGFGLGLGSQDRGRFNERFFNDDGSDWAGGVVGKFTFRYPIPCSRFAPYAFIGVGGIWGGEDNSFNGDFNNVFVDNNNDDGGRFMVQYGAGFEVRFTPHVGMITDIVYNQLEDGGNDFIMLRTGLNFAF